MIGMSAVIFIPDDTAKTGYPQPLMLQSVMGAPLLAWLANALFDSGVGRFFLVCHDRYVEAARACLPAEAEVMTTMDSDPADLLHVFLSTAEDAEHTITVVTGPAVYLPQLAPQAAGRFPRGADAGARRAFLLCPLPAGQRLPHERGAGHVFRRLPGRAAGDRGPAAAQPPAGPRPHGRGDL